VRCLKHEGEPPRFGARERTNGTARGSGDGRVKKKTTTTRRAATKKA
jgi:hypothetical protein